MSRQETEEEDDWEEQEPARRSSIQESLSLPVPVFYPENDETKEEPKAMAELSNSPSLSLSPSQGGSIESSGGLSLSPQNDITASVTPSGSMQNVKKRESKVKEKVLKGMKDSKRFVLTWEFILLYFYFIFYFFGQMN